MFSTPTTVAILFVASFEAVRARFSVSVPSPPNKTSPVLYVVPVAVNVSLPKFDVVPAEPTKVPEMSVPVVSDQV